MIYSPKRHHINTQTGWRNEVHKRLTTVQTELLGQASITILGSMATVTPRWMMRRLNRMDIPGLLNRVMNIKLARNQFQSWSALSLNVEDVHQDETTDDTTTHQGRRGMPWGAARWCQGHSIIQTHLARVKVASRIYCGWGLDVYEVYKNLTTCHSPG